MADHKPHPRVDRAGILSPRDHMLGGIVCAGIVAALIFYFRVEHACWWYGIIPLFALASVVSIIQALTAHLFRCEVCGHHLKKEFHDVQLDGKPRMVCGACYLTLRLEQSEAASKTFFQGKR